MMRLAVNLKWAGEILKYTVSNLKETKRLHQIEI